jgi:hypothetical protein
MQSGFAVDPDPESIFISEIVCSDYAVWLLCILFFRKSLGRGFTLVYNATTNNRFRELEARLLSYV